VKEKTLQEFFNNKTGWNGANVYIGIDRRSTRFGWDVWLLSYLRGYTLYC